MSIDNSSNIDDRKELKKNEIYVQNDGCQTDKLVFKDKGIQLKKKSDFQMQTEDEIEEDIKLYEDDSAELLSFIKRIVPLAEQELINNEKSKAFIGYDVQWSQNVNEISCIHTLQQNKVAQELLITCLSWNATGSVIAASYGSFEHESWCTHKSVLCTWNVDRVHLDARKCDVCIEVPTCIMSLAYHPKEPSWLACACFNGEIMVWDLSRPDDMLIGNSKIGMDTHRESVSKIVWVKGEANKYQLVSVGNDGRILFWAHDVYRKTLKLSDGFVILTESLPRQLRSRSGAGKQVGVTCVDFCPSDETAFIVGSDCGAIFKCSTDTRGTPASADIPCSVQLRSPVNFAFECHSGPVNSVQYSPFARNIFVSCSADSAFRIYSVLQIPPLVIIEPNEGFIQSCLWSPSRASVLYLSTSSGLVLIYDFVKSQSTAAKRLAAAESAANSPVYSLAISQNRNDLLAAGNEKGEIMIWKLDEYHRNSLPNDLPVLLEMTQAFSE